MSIHAAHDALTMFLDTLSSEPDEMRRLHDIHRIQPRLYSDFWEVKGRAAYQARQRFATHDILDVLGTQRGQLHYWVTQYAQRHGLPNPMRRERVDLSEYIDLTMEKGER